MTEDQDAEFGAKGRHRLMLCGSVTLLIASLAISTGSAKQPLSDQDWPIYGGSSAGERYSKLTQITPANVNRLTEAWRVETGPGGLQTSPIMIGRVLYVCAPDQSVMALDAATGKQIWRFSSGTPGFQPIRGLTYWQEGGDRRLFASSSTFLYALDPVSGQPIKSFGTDGRIDLREGLGRDPQALAVFLTTPGIIYRDVIITGFRTGEGAPTAPGDIRAFDVRSGKLRWSFKTIPDNGEPGSEHWPKDARNITGGANNWAGMALDEKRGIVFVPTGSAASDFYGANRPGDNRYANSLLALDAATGQLRWHFQAVHHDLWDRDFGTPPTLLTVRRGGRLVDVVAQANKQGFLFVFERETGKPIFPIEERPVPQSTVPGEHTAATQPFPTLPKPLARQRLTEDMLTKRTPASHAAVLDAFRQTESGEAFTPLGTERKTIVMPSFDGGPDWGGAAVDPARGILYINSQDVPSMGSLQANKPGAQSSPGKLIYDQNCAACHGLERKGNPPDFPSLVGLSKRLDRPTTEAVIVNGKGRMPGFPQLTTSERQALLTHLLDTATVEGAAAYLSMPPAMLAEFRRLAGPRQEPYLFTGYERFRDPDGYPAIVPPWGTLNAIDLNTGAYLWTVPLGEYPELIKAGMGVTGSENWGGPLLTASRLLFIGATVYDRKFRAFDSRTGRTVWETTLPYAGVATPISYSVDGRQFVVIATSGSRDPKGPQGSAYVAYALPSRN